MNKKYLYIAGGVAVAALLLHACSDDNEYISGTPASSLVVQPQPQAQQPVIVQSQPQPVVVHDHNSGFLSGMLMGHLMSGGGHSYHSHTTVVHHFSTPRYAAPKRYYGSRFRTVTRSRTTYRSYGRRR